MCLSNRFAVIGNPITHSLSPEIHQRFAQQTQVQLTYEKIMGEDLYFESQVSDFFTQGGRGLNITLPFKQRAFAMAKDRTPRCQSAGAANTLWMKDGQLCADNTDGVGLVRDLSRFTKLPGKRILVLGAGGAVRGIIYPLLEEKPVSLVIANRTKAKVDELQAAFPQIIGVDITHLSGEFDLIINGTSASLGGNTVTLPNECFATVPLCYDLAYKQKNDTAFVAYAKSFGCEAVDGLGMLVEQAAEAFFIWNGVRPSVEPVLRHVREM